MSHRFEFRPDRRAGPLLASAMVIFLGGLGVAIVAAAGGSDPIAVLIIFGCVIGIVLCLSLFGRAAPSQTLGRLYGWVTSKEARPAMDYVPKTTREKAIRYGTNAPPSADEVRDLKEGLNNWVPGRTPTARRRPSDRESDR